MKGSPHEDIDVRLCAASPGLDEGRGGAACTEDGTSLNQFVANAVAEKVAALRTARYFAERKGRADWNAFDRFMQRAAFAPLDVQGDEAPGSHAGPGRRDVDR